MGYFGRSITTIIFVFIIVLILRKYQTYLQYSRLAATQQQTMCTCEGVRSIVTPTDMSAFTSPPNPSEKYVRFPDAIIIGEMKCGTSAMQFFLKHHPDVAMSKDEVNFFSLRYNMGWDWYKTQLEPSYPSQVCMEKSVYFGSEAHLKAWEKIYAYKPDVKMILNVRDPVERIMSHYNMESSLKKFFYDHSLEDFIYRHDNPKMINSSNQFIQRGLYYTHMLRWLKFFPLNQILVIDARTFKQNPLEELIRAEQHLGIRSFFNKQRFFFDEEKGFYCLRLETSVECMPTWATSNPKRQYSEELLTELRNYYKPQVFKFYELIGVNYNWTSSL